MTEPAKNGKCQPSEGIVIAAGQGRLDLVTELLEKGEDPNTVDEVGTSALHNAAKGGHWDVARLLLEKNAIPGLLDGNNATPLLFAVRGGHSQVVRLLLECQPAMEGVKDETRETELHRSLRIAAFSGQTELVKLLLDHNAPTLSDAGNETALLDAAKKGYSDICELLIKHDMALNRSFWSRMTGPSLAVDGKDYTGNTPLAHAVKGKFSETVDVFLRHYPNLCKARDSDKQLLFHYAIRLGNIEMTRVFLKRGADVEMKGSYGNRALHEAIMGQSIYYTPVEKTAEMIRLLIDHGASVTSTNADGRTPEFGACGPMLRTLLRTYRKTQSKADPSQMTPKSLAPPPEYKA